MAEEFLPLTKTEQDNDTSWYTSVAAGIASGIIKIPEGVFSLAAELIDLGADTNLAADVDKFFDDLNPFEEVAEENALGRLTEALIQVGVPGTIGFKAANKLARNITARALKAKRTNAFASFKKTKDRAKLSTALDKGAREPLPMRFREPMWPKRRERSGLPLALCNWARYSNLILAISTPEGHSALHALQATQSSMTPYKSGPVSSDAGSWPDRTARKALARPRVLCFSSRVTMKLGHIVPVSR